MKIKKKEKKNMKKKKMAIFYSKIIVQIPKRCYYILSKIIIKRNRFFLDTDFSHRFDFDNNAAEG